MRVIDVLQFGTRIYYDVTNYLKFKKLITINNNNNNNNINDLT